MKNSSKHIKFSLKNTSPLSKSALSYMVLVVNIHGHILQKYIEVFFLESVRGIFFNSKT